MPVRWAKKYLRKGITTPGSGIEIQLSGRTLGGGLSVPAEFLLDVAAGGDLVTIFDGDRERSTHQFSELDIDLPG